KVSACCSTCPARAPRMKTRVARHAQVENELSTLRARISLNPIKAAIARMAAKRSGAKMKGPMATAFMSLPHSVQGCLQRFNGHVADQPGALCLRRLTVEEDHGRRADHDQIAHQRLVGVARGVGIDVT